MPFATINDTMIYYEVSGSGTPILFIHPPLLTGAIFTSQRTHLSDEFAVITMDIRGHGHSAFSQKQLSYSLIVEDLVQLLDHLKLDQVFLCGYSTGGSVVLEAMLTHPERIRGGILVSAMSELNNGTVRSLISLAVGVTHLRAKQIAAFFIALGNAHNLHEFKSLYKDATRAGNPENWSQYFKCSLAYDCTNSLGQIKLPTLIIQGQKDYRFSQSTRVLRQGLVHSQLKMIEGVGHQIPTKGALQLNRIIRDWLRKGG